MLLNFLFLSCGSLARLAANNVQTLLENISDIEDKIRKLQARVRTEVENCPNVPTSQGNPLLANNTRRTQLSAQHANSNRMSDKRSNLVSQNSSLASLDQQQLSPVHTTNSTATGANLIVPRGRQFNLLHSEGFSLLTSGATGGGELSGPLSPHSSLHASALILSNNANNPPSSGLTGPLIAEPHLGTSEIRKVRLLAHSACFRSFLRWMRNSRSS